MNTSTITLYKDAKFDIYRRMSNFVSGVNQKAYYDGLTNKKTFGARFNKLGDPFIVAEDISDLIGYTTGRVTYKNHDYYFQIMDLYTIAEGTTEVRYQLNAWESFRYNPADAKGIQLGHGTITKLNYDYLGPKFMVRSEITPTAYEIEDLDIALGEAPRKPCVLAVGRDNTSDWTYFICLDIENTSRNHALTNTSAFAHYINDAMKTVSENFELIGMWYSSFEPPISTWTATNTNRVYYKSVTDSTFTMQSIVQTATIPVGKLNSIFGEAKIMNRYNKMVHFCDERGNIIFTLPDRMEMSSSYFMVLNMSMSSCQWIFNINYESVNRVFTDTFTLACEPMDFYNDSWYAYQSTQRQTDIDSRNLENSKNAISGLAGVSTSALSGAIAGSLVAPGIGTMVGAVAGGIASTVGVAVDTLFNTLYANPKEQEITDVSYKRTADTLTLQGNGVNGTMMALEFISSNPMQRFGAGFKVFTYDDYTTNLLDEIYSVYGCDCTIVTDNVDGRFPVGDNIPFQATCEINGIPSNWAGQIQERLANGVFLSND